MAAKVSAAIPWRAGVEGDEEPGSMGNEEETLMKATYAVNRLPVSPIGYQDRISIIGSEYQLSVSNKR